MEVIELDSHLAIADLFALFKAQVKKDFEGAGLDGDFADQLPAQFGALCAKIREQVKPLVASHSSHLQTLLYRVDISEKQLRDYRPQGPDQGFEAQIAELIIKRVLQKVIFKKKFSK